MKIIQVFKTGLITISLLNVSNVYSLTEEDISDYTESSGIGCQLKEPLSEKADYHIVCKSKESGETAWNAALYRGKLACGKDKFSILFNIPPALPVENGIHGAQIEINCGKKT